MTGRVEGTDNRGRLLAALAAIEALQARLERAEQGAVEPVAIVGIGCRFPGEINGPEEYWQVLREGRDVVGEVPAERWDINSFYDPSPDAPGKIVTRDAGCLRNIDMFDPVFFGMSVKEAAAMDPQQRIALEVAKEAFDDAGMAERLLGGSATGVFLGLTESEYAWIQHGNLTAADGYTSTGLYGGVAANRISYVFDLKGPSFTVDSICSSSLLAVHLAVESLRRGECTAALAGGVCVLTGPDQMIWLSKLGTVSPGGRCRAFAADADGIVLGEGCGFVVLKPLGRAVADRDRIYALVNGSGVSQDGRSNGLTAPSRSGQEAMLREAYRRARIAPSAVHYVDAHGTGTSLGDPIEAAALGAVLGAGRPADRPCYVGSAKTNLAHLGPVGGIASLIKTALAIAHREVPASLHFSKPNPHIPFSDLKLKVADRLVPWPANDEPAVAGVSSLAFGGTNVHVVLSEQPAQPASPVTAVTGGFSILPISAADPTALKLVAKAYSERLPGCGGINAVAAAAACRRGHYAFRAALVGRNPDAVADLCREMAEGRQADGLYQGMASLAGAPKIAFVFSGHGSQYAGMCRGLLAASAEFRTSLEASDRAIHAATGWSVLEILRNGDPGPWLQRVDLVQPVLFAIQVGLAEMWRALGIRPAAVIGSSVGEVAAAHVGGHLSLADAVRIVCGRSRLLEQHSGRGAMGFVELSAEAAQHVIHGREDRLAIAVVNGARSCVLSGDPGALEEVFAILDRREVFCRRVDVTIASHSPQMDMLRTPMRELVTGISPRDGAIAFCSTVDRDFLDGAQLDAEYWFRNLREPVHFGDGIARLAASGCEVFLEISPHPVSTPAATEILSEKGRRCVALPSLHREHDDWRAVLNALAELYVRGCDPIWPSIYPDAVPLPLPRYPWQRQRLWLASAARHEVARSTGSAGDHPLLSARRESALHPGEFSWELCLDPVAHPFLNEHKVLGRVVLPAAASLELVLSALRLLDADPAATLVNVAFERAIEVEAGPIRPDLQLVLSRVDAGTFSFIIVRRDASNGTWETCVKGIAEIGDAAQRPHPVNAGSQGLVAAEPSHFYDSLARIGGEYGLEFRRLAALDVGAGVAYARIGAHGGRPGFAVDPTVLDAAMQSALALLPPGEVAIPSSIGRFRMFAAAAPELPLSVRVGPHASPDGCHRFDIEIVDGENNRLAQFENVEFRSLRPQASADARIYHAVRWERLVRPAAPPEPSCWLFFADGLGLTDRVVKAMQAQGHRCERVRRAQAFSREDFSRELEQRFAGDQRPLRGVVYGWALDEAAEAEAIVRDCRSALALIQALSGDTAAGLARLFILTRGGQAAVEGDTVVPGQACLWGLVRVALLEEPERHRTLIDLPLDAAPLAADVLAPWLEAAGSEHQLAVRGNDVLAARIESVPPPPATAAPARNRSFHLTLSAPGQFEALRAVEAGRQPIGADEVEIRVVAAGLNFMDVLRGLGVLKFATAGGGLQFGMECSGEVVGVGASVSGIKVGDRVIAITPEPRCLATHVTTSAAFVTPMPALPPAAAAGLPIAYMTALYALEDIARVTEGDHVLIHAATGGVGLAALAIARRAGAVVHATAGSEAKRDYLRGLGVNQVYDSRSLAFAEQIRQATAGRGVDIVLNSLAGAAMQASVDLLASFGRFIEIGKRDQQEGNAIDLTAFSRSLSYISVDLARIMRERQDIASALLSRSMAAVRDGILPVLPHIALPVVDAERAFRLFTRAEHIGKVVVGFDQADTVAVMPDDRAALLRRDGAYLVTGGFGGLGLTLTHWLAKQGAGLIVLTGRRDPRPAARDAIAALVASGVDLECRIVDVGDATAMDRLFAGLATARLPLRGIFHLAAAGDDGLLSDLTWPRFETALLPKVQGTRHLDRLSRSFDLDHFVLFSSTASVLGAAGQANYAAANAFLDAVATERQALGLPALSIAWGPWASIGGAAERGLEKRFENRGLVPLPPETALAALKRLLLADLPAMMVASFDAERWAKFYPSAASLVGRSDERAVAVSLVERLGALGSRDRAALLSEYLRTEVATVLGVPVARIDPERTAMSQLGLDSLMALELRARLEGGLGLKLSATLIWNYPTLPALADYLMARLGFEVARAEAAFPAMAAITDAPLDLEAMSDEAAEAMLVERLNEMTVHK